MPGLTRLGSDYGGWTIPVDLLDGESVCYSGGVGQDITFDRELISRCGCKVFAFDPTPASIAYLETLDLPPELRFMASALCGADGPRELHPFNPRDGSFSVNLRGPGEGEPFVAQCRTLRSLMAELGHDRIDLLKLDIEGSEYEVVHSMLADSIDVGILCIEFHRTPLIRKMNATVRRLKHAGYVPVHLRYFDATFVAADLLE